MEMGVDERVFREHLECGPFQSGVARDRWRLISMTWPHAIIAVSAASREKAPKQYAFRFELTNYPQSPPTAQLWDIEKGITLEHGKRPHGNKRISLAFRTDWKDGQVLYLPCDRQALSSHTNWRTEHPDLLWSSDGDITQCLRIIHDLLNSIDYTGTNSASMQS
jgi:hypothetical protein